MKKFATITKNQHFFIFTIAVFVSLLATYFLWSNDYTYCNQNNLSAACIVEFVIWGILNFAVIAPSLYAARYLFLLWLNALQPLKPVKNKETRAGKSVFSNQPIR